MDQLWPVEKRKRLVVDSRYRKVFVSHCISKMIHSKTLVETFWIFRNRWFFSDFFSRKFEYDRSKKDFKAIIFCYQSFFLRWPFFSIFSRLRWTWPNNICRSLEGSLPTGFIIATTLRQPALKPKDFCTAKDMTMKNDVMRLWTHHRLIHFLQGGWKCSVDWMVPNCLLTGCWLFLHFWNVITEYWSWNTTNQSHT